MTHTVVIERELAMTTRDGVVLASDVYRPDAAGPFPTLIYRVRGGRSSAFIAGFMLLNPLDAVERGYAVVIQEVRGRAASEDRWEPFVHERDDSEERKGTYRLKAVVTLSGDLTDAQRQELLSVAGKCPVHKLMTQVTTEVTTVLAEA